ncbi:MAG: hypothetical protein HY840_11495 [Bacteroidetes bacterium]|nr:hypothetical protein [Bacteroidota bacterium]
MKTKDSTSSVLEENMHNATKSFSEISSAMTEIYNKQFQFGYDMLNNFMNVGIQERLESSNFGSKPFISGIEMFQKNMKDSYDLSQNNMSVFMKSYSGKPADYFNGESLAGNVLRAYNQQLKQISDTNQHFMKTFDEIFKSSNEDVNKFFDSFRENMGRNQRMAEGGINSAMKTYNSITNKSAKDTMEMFDKINKQMESLTKNNMNLWSDLLQKTEKVTSRTNDRQKEKKSKK